VTEKQKANMSTPSNANSNSNSNSNNNNGDTSQLCTFVLGNVLFGIDVMSVQEVIRHQEMTPVPLTSRVVRGLINLRGQIVTAIDMRARLGLRERAGDVDLLPPLMNVVVRTSDGGVVSLLVDEIGDVLEVDSGSFERVPETLAGSIRDHVRGVYKLDGRLLLLLDAECVAALGADAVLPGQPS
jgi:purine-binding chemotaxis protein CheW